MNDDSNPALTIERDGDDIFVKLEGVGTIAKRGHPGTPQARTWVSLQPGWRVLDGPGGDLVVEFDNPSAH